MSQAPTIVLAHGAWADGSCWSNVITGLAAQGVRSVAAPLPLTTFQNDADALDRTIERAGGDVILVGHAYAGAVIAASTSKRVKALVYIAALAPDEGETVADVFSRVDPHPKAPKLTPNRHGLIYLPDAAFTDAFAQHASADEQNVLRAIQRPLSPACITVKMGRPLWRDIPVWYLLAEEDRMIVAETQAFMAGRMNAQVRRHLVDHSPSITAPKVCIDIILEALSALQEV